MSKELIESVKEGLRVFLMAVIPLAIAELSSGNSFDFKAIGVAGIIAVLRFVDKYLHESGVAEKGLTRF